jgi:hypothetical protein
MSESMKVRIDRMFRGDRYFAYGFVIVLWAVVLFVFFRVYETIGGGMVTTVLIGGGAMVLFLNTAAIVAMIHHYTHEKDFIYGLDIRHLDEMRSAKSQG